MNTDLPHWTQKVKERIMVVPVPAGLDILQPALTFLTGRMFLFNFMVGFLLMAIVIVGQDIKQNSLRLELAGLQRQELITKINKWQGVVGQYPGYRDGYYQLAVLEDQLGNKQLAYGYMVKALTLDPDFTAGRKFLNTLVK